MWREFLEAVADMVFHTHLWILTKEKRKHLLVSVKDGDNKLYQSCVTAKQVWIEHDYCPTQN